MSGEQLRYPKCKICEAEHSLASGHVFKDDSVNSRVNKAVNKAKNVNKVVNKVEEVNILPVNKVNNPCTRCCGSGIEPGVVGRKAYMREYMKRRRGVGVKG